MTSHQSSAQRRLAPSAKTMAALGVAAFMAACATAPAPQTLPPRPGGPVAPPPSPTPGPVTQQQGVTPPFMAGRNIVRVGLLLPFSLRPQDASALYNAAELALFDIGDENTLLIPRDAGSDEAAAAAAATALANDGADIIIGPVLREGVLGAGRGVRSHQIPVIGFSSDRTVAGSGVYLLSFQLEDEVSRIVSYAASRNIRSIALLAPSNEYGRRVEQALRAESQSRGVTVTAVQLYNRSDVDAGAAATALATSMRTAPAQAVLIAESGTPLRAIGASLVAGGVDPRRTKFIGTSAWAADASREPTLVGGWYVSPDQSARTDFEQRYQAMFNTAPTRLSSLAYDAVALAALLSRDVGADGFRLTAIENPEGFAGSDGLFRFRADGSIERGLAIMEVRPNGDVAVDAAPRRFGRVSG